MHTIEKVGCQDQATPYPDQDIGLPLALIKDSCTVTQQTFMREHPYNRGQEGAAEAGAEHCQKMLQRILLP